MSRPLVGDYGSFYQGYIDAAKGNSLNDLIAGYPKQIQQFITNLPEEKADFCYAPGKWTIKQMLQHLIDTERVFSYRALRISRNDQTAMAGFDENAFAQHAPVDHRTLTELKQEFLLIREATDLQLKAFTEAQLKLSGIASNHHITLNAICFIIYGHNLHHLRILKERYLQSEK